MILCCELFFAAASRLRRSSLFASSAMADDYCWSILLEFSIFFYAVSMLVATSACRRSGLVLSFCCLPIDKEWFSSSPQSSQLHLRRQTERLFNHHEELRTYGHHGYGRTYSSWRVTHDPNDLAGLARFFLVQCHATCSMHACHDAKIAPHRGER